MKISIVVPAFNEERLITRCLDAIASALAANNHFTFESEVIVVDNNSTDRTADLAGAAGARVCFESINQIGRARNTGAAAATGEWLMFVDADSFVSGGLVADILQLIASGTKVGCGSTMRMDGLPTAAEMVLMGWTRISIWCRWAAGSLFVCRADAFREVGGFNEALYAAEEVDLSRRLKKWGRSRGLKFEILTANPLLTSSRKIRLYSGWEITRQFFWLIVRPLATLRDSKRLSIWYDGRR
jgi:glycosyltransferase involved in cell wall biosynthesis